MKLTKKQSDILDFIQKVLLNNGYPPTLREIAAQFKIKSVRTIFDRAVSLEKKGYAKRDQGKKRGFHLVKVEDEVLARRFENKGDEIRLKPANKEMAHLIIKERGGKKIEIIGRVVALLRSY